MASRLSYHRLRQEVIFEDERQVILGSRSTRFNWLRRLKRRRFRIKIAGLRRFFRFKRSTRAGSRRRISWSKIVKRLKESKNHWGDLFAGNYLFMQVAPTTLSKSPIDKICATIQQNNAAIKDAKLKQLTSGFAGPARYNIAA